MINKEGFILYESEIVSMQELSSSITNNLKLNRYNFFVVKWDDNTNVDIVSEVVESIILGYVDSVERHISKKICDLSSEKIK